MINIGLTNTPFKELIEDIGSETLQETMMIGELGMQPTLWFVAGIALIVLLAGVKYLGRGRKYGSVASLIEAGALSFFLTGIMSILVILGISWEIEGLFNLGNYLTWLFAVIAIILVIIGLLGALFKVVMNLTEPIRAQTNEETL